MSGAASKFRDWVPAGDSVDPSGVGGFVPLITIPEPLSEGPPPTAPGLVRQISTGMTVRTVRSLSNHRVTAPMDLATRPTFGLTWSGLTKTQATALRTFLDQTCGAGISGFDVDIDDSGDVVVALALGACTVRQVAPGVAGVADGEGVYQVEVGVVVGVGA